MAQGQECNCTYHRYSSTDSLPFLPARPTDVVLVHQLGSLIKSVMRSGKRRPVRFAML